MSDSIGALVVEISASTATFESALTRAAYQMDQTMGQMAASTSRLGGALAAIDTQLATFGVSLRGLAGIAAIGGFAEMIKGSIDSQAELGRLADRAGTTVEALSSMRLAAKEGGLSLESVATGSARLSKAIFEAQDGTTKAAQALQLLGLDAEKLNLLTPEEQLRTIAIALAGFQDSGAKTAVVMELLGKSGATFQAFLKALAIDAPLAASVTTEMANAARETEAQFAVLGDQATILKTAIANQFVPALTQVAKAFADANQGTGGTAQFWGAIATGVRVAAIAYEGLVASLRGVATSYAFLETVKIDLLHGDLAKAKGDLDAYRDSLVLIENDFRRFVETTAQGSPTLENLSGTAHKASDAASVLALESFYADTGLKQMASSSDLASGSLAKLDQVIASIEGKDLGVGGFAPGFAALTAGFNSGALSLERYQQLTRELLNQQPWATKHASEIQKLVDAQQRAVDSEIEWLSKLHDEAATVGLSEGALLRYQAASKGWGDASEDAITELVTAKLNQADLNEELKKSTKDYQDLAAAIESANKKRDTDLASLIKGNDALKIQLDTLGLSGTQQQIYVTQLQLTQAAHDGDANAVSVLTDRLNILNQTAAKQDLITAAENAKRAWEETANSIEKALEDGFFNAFKKGDSFGQGLRDALEQMFRTLVLRPILQPIAGGIATELQSVLGFAAPTNASAYGQGISGLGNLLPGGGLSSLLSSGAGQALGLSGVAPASAALAGLTEAELGAGAAAAVGAEAAGSAGLALTSLGTAALAAIPVVGWVAAAGLLAYSLFSNKSPTPTSGQFQITGGAPTGFEDAASTASRYGNIGFRDVGTSEFSGSDAQQFNTTVSGLLDLFAARETAPQIAATTSALQATPFPGFTGTFNTADFIKQYGSQILQQVAEVAFQTLDPALASAIEAFKGTGDALTKFIGSLLVLHDVAATLPEDISAKLEGALDGTQATLDKITSFALAFSNIQKVVSGDPLADALKTIDAQAKTLTTTFFDQATALRALITNFDGSASAATQLATATGQYYTAEVALLAQIEQIKTAISAMFGDTVRSITLQTLDKPGQYAYLQAEAERLRTQISTTSDPQQIQNLATQINRDIGQAFNLLDPNQQRSQLAAYTANINAFNAEVTARLNAVSADVQHSAADTMNEAAAKITDAVNAMTQAAGVDLQASQNNLTASQTPIVVDVNILPVPSGDGQVNG